MSRTLLFALTLISLLIPLRGHAQEYPSRPVKLIISVSAGGAFDTFARALAQELQKQWGQAVVIEPRPGGNYMIAGRACAEAIPDGYTLCAVTGETIVHAPLLYRDARYDTEKSFTPITQLFYTTLLLAANSKINVKTLAELAVKAKATPHSFAGLNLFHKLFIARFNKQHETEIVFVPQRGGADALNNVVAGHTGIAISNGATFLPFVQEGKLVPLAIDSLSRSPLYPDVPTLAEAGYPEGIIRGYLGLVAPSGIPPYIVQRVHDTVLRIASNREFRERIFINRGLEPILNSPEEFSKFMKAEAVSFIELMKEANLTLQ